jgi:flagellar biosynthetic protein FliP
MPPNQVLVGIALFLSLFVMGPTLDKVNTQAIAPYRAGDITETQAIERGLEPMRSFMFKQTRTSDLARFVRLSGEKTRPVKTADVPFKVLVPAFVTSELKSAFQIGFLVFLPFLIIDMIVASTLTSMGMMMLPPVLVSLPFKVLLFVLVDGWHLVVESLVNSFRV